MRRPNLTLRDGETRPVPAKAETGRVRIAEDFTHAATLLAIPVGMFVGPLYPLAAAQAYACRPNASGSVLAAGHLFTPLGLALPFAIGALADAAGTTAALAVLVVQPLGLLVLVAVTRRKPA